MSKCYKSVVEAAQGLFVAGCLILSVVLLVLVMWGISIAIGDGPITFLVVVVCIFLGSGLVVAYDAYRTKKNRTPEQEEQRKTEFEELT